MRKAAVALAVGLVFATAVVAAPAAVRPSLKLVSVHPLVVAGQGFKPLASVRVVVTTGQETLRRSVRANARGSFRVNFGELSLDRCTLGFGVRAIGSGRTAVLKLPPQPACAPQRSP